MKKNLCLIPFAIFAWIQFCHAQQNLFKNGDRICYIGSSIAMNGGCFHYTNLFYATRYPETNLHFFNCGISGEVTDEILTRIDEDILINHPTWCVTMIEENDLRPSLYLAERQNEPGIKERQEEAVQHWMTNTDLIVEKLLDHNIKVILQTPTIVDEVVKSSIPSYPGINKNLKRCAEHLKSLGKKYSLPVVDCWTVMYEINSKLQKNDSTKTIIGRDRLHVSKMGYFIMSSEFLQMQKVSSKVSQIVINAPKNEVVHYENCDINALNAKPEAVSFTTRAHALPFPTPDEVYPDSFFCFTKELNADILQVKGLKKGNYILHIDGTEIAGFSVEELNEGINLSKFHNTPQYLQAEKVLDRFEEYWKNERILRTIKYVEYQHRRDLKGISNVEQLKTELPNIMEKYKTSDNYNFFTNMFNAYITNKPLEAELYNKAEQILLEISKLNKPVAHNYSIRRAGN